MPFARLPRADQDIFALTDELVEAEATSCWRHLVEKLSAVDLLRLEDFGIRKLPATAAADLLNIIMRRHEQRSTMITTNRPTEDWDNFLSDGPPPRWFQLIQHRWKVGRELSIPVMSCLGVLKPLK